MEKGVVFLFIFLLFLSSFSLVLAEDDEIVNLGEASGVSGGTQDVSSSSGEAEMKYTTNFYIALGLGVFAVLLCLYIAFIFIRGPKDRWKQRVKKEKKDDEQPQEMEQPQVQQPQMMQQRPVMRPGFPQRRPY